MKSVNTQPNLFNQVYKLVNTIPKGKVVSYGQVASALGNPRAARTIGWALHLLDTSNTTVPWWRVINNAGFLSIRGNFLLTRQLQRKLLIKEKVQVDKEFKLDIEKYRHKFK